VVQPGDTIRSLAERSSSTVAQLAAANCLQNPRLIYAGQLFYVPRRIRE
jgi:LysM repeat protein